MLKLNAAAFHRAATCLTEFMGHTRGAGTVPTNVPLGTTSRDTFKALAKELLVELEILQTRSAHTRTSRFLETLDNPKFTYDDFAEAVEDITSRVQDDLLYACVYVLDESKIKFFECPEGQFGADVSTKFSTAAFEIDEAGKCLALHRGTACVFHLMRVLEVGIQSARKCLGIPDPIKDAERNWGAILRKFKAELERRNAVPSNWNGEDRRFFEEVYASLDAVRNVWRNPTMHVENKYTVEEADHIFSAVRGFMKKLSGRMDEGGLPLA